MPELPEVETTRRGLARLIIDKTIENIRIHQPKLRWPIPDDLKQIPGQRILNLKRRGKYLLFELSSKNYILMHLGMSGSVSVIATDQPRKKHDHFEMTFSNNHVLRFHDPRRFGSILMTDHEPDKHRLLIHLGPEPLSTEFTGQWLKTLAQNRTVAVKNFIMNSHVVVGVGNIYASEALFMAGIHPKRAVKNISLKRYQLLAEAIKQVLEKAIIAASLQS